MTIWTQESYISHTIIIGISVQMVYFERNSFSDRMFFIPPTQRTFFSILFQEKSLYMTRNVFCNNCSFTCEPFFFKDSKAVI